MAGTPTPLQRFRAFVAYDGTDFLGFQIQASGRTVQGVLEKGLTKVTKNSTRLLAAGRTDTGVHATGQVIAFNLAWRHGIKKLQRALNANLPGDVVIVKIEPTKPDFHPRFDALNRQYQYIVLNQPVQDVIRRRHVAHIFKPLDVDRMNEASLCLLGTHDFASFGQPPQGSNTVRTVTEAVWYKNDCELKFYITANAFLYRMVRAIVATLIEVGLHKLRIEEVKNILQAKDRTQVKWLASASGLYLVNITYTH